MVVVKCLGGGAGMAVNGLGWESLGRTDWEKNLFNTHTYIYDYDYDYEYLVSMEWSRQR